MKTMKENDTSIKENEWLFKELIATRNAPRRVYVFSADKVNYYKIYAPNKRSAIQVAMSIGENEPPKTDMPPSPGKTEPVPAHQVSTFSTIVVPISKQKAKLLIQKESLLCERNKTKIALQKTKTKRGR